MAEYIKLDDAIEVFVTGRKDTMAEPKPTMFKGKTVCNACPKLMDCMYDGTVSEWSDFDYTFTRKCYVAGLEDIRYGPSGDKNAKCPYVKDGDDNGET